MLGLNVQYLSAVLIEGEPVLCGFARSFGLKVGSERREWIKPIMFSGGVGSIDDKYIKKEVPHPG